MCSLVSGSRRSVPCGIQLDAEKTETLTDARANRRGVLADTRREHQGVETAQRRGEGAHPFSGLMAEEDDRFRRPTVLSLTIEEVPHVEAGLGDAEETRFMGHQMIELRHRHLLGACQKRHD